MSEGRSFVGDPAGPRKPEAAKTNRLKAGMKSAQMLANEWDRGKVHTNHPGPEAVGLRGF